MLQNAYLDAKIGFDPDENEPPEEEDGPSMHAGASWNFSGSAPGQPRTESAASRYNMDEVVPEPLDASCGTYLFEIHSTKLGPKNDQSPEHFDVTYHVSTNSWSSSAHSVRRRWTASRCRIWIQHTRFQMCVLRFACKDILYIIS